jgi:hypothetical protein
VEPNKLTNEEEIVRVLEITMELKGAWEGDVWFNTDMNTWRYYDYTTSQACSHATYGQASYGASFSAYKADNG